MKQLGWPIVTLGAVGCLCIGGLTAVALFRGIDGMAYAGGIGAITAIIGGIVGFKVAKGK